jgi:NADPH:quinone reductase-like Zn-dependent oxidoreductase
MPMKAVVYAKFGSPDALRLTDVEKPVPRDHEILVRTRAVSLNAYDWRHLRADPFMIRFMGAGLFKPKHPILGADVAGQVEAAGVRAGQFRPGDEVFGDVAYGGLAEYLCADESRFVRKPGGLTFEEAAAVPMAGLTALQGLRDKGRIRQGQKVLINGASGGVGSFAVQIAKSYETEVTAVCRTAKMEFVSSLGADHVIDHTKEDVTDSDRKYDLIFDVAAYRSVLAYKRILSPAGTYVLAGGAMARILQLMVRSATGAKNMGVIVAKASQEDLGDLVEMIQAGSVKPMVDRCYSLDSAADAFRYLEEGHARGKVVITVASC